MTLGIEVEFHIEMPPELDELNLEAMADEIVERSAELAREEWTRLAGENLQVAKEQYIEAISPIDRPNSFEAVITLEGVFPNMLEQGHEAFDMKPGLLNGPNVKTSSTGIRFQDIRFPYGTPSQKQIKTLPKDIFKKVSSMQMGQRYSDKNKLKNWNMGRPGGYEHKTGIYDDLHRARPKGTGLTEFQTFRRVSENSDPSSWIHPGLKALLLSERVKEFLGGQIEGIIEEILGKGFE